MPELAEEVKKAIDEIGKSHHEFKKTHSTLENEVKKLGKESAETAEKLDKIDKGIQDAVELKQQLEEMQTAIARFHQSQEENGNVKSDEQREHEAKFARYIRKCDDNGLREAEQKAMSVNSEPDGGYWVTPDMSGRMVTKIFETSPVRSVAAIQPISTDALEGMVDTDEATVGWTAEETVPTEQATPQIGTWRIPVHEQYALVKATQKLLEDSAVNVEAWLIEKIVAKFARNENDAFINGNGVGKPRGMLTHTAGTDIGSKQIEQVNSGSAGNFTADGLFDLQYALKFEYAANATFAAGRLAWRDIRKLKDADNQYLWAPGLQAGQPATLLGSPTIVFNDLPDPAADALSLVYADFQQFYQIVDRIGLALLRDPYSSKPFVEFYARRRVGGGVHNFEAGKIHKLAA